MNKKSIFAIAMILTFSLFGFIGCTKEKLPSQEVNKKDESHQKTEEAFDDSLKESNIPVKYTLQQSKNNGDYIIITDQSETLNIEKLEKFLEEFKNKKPAKIRCAEFYMNCLDSMRDIEYDGEKILLKEYDTKSKDKKTYSYMEISDSDMIQDGGWYRLANSKAKLFYINKQ